MRALTSSIAAAVAAVLLLAGCSSVPPRAEVVERFAIELEGTSDGLMPRDDPGVLELAGGLADDALAGRCDSAAYRSQLEGSPDLVYVWLTVCSTLFEDDMTAAQLEEARELLLERTLERPSDG